MSEERPAVDALDLIEGIHAVTEILDSFKKALEERGWSASAAEHAAIVWFQTERLKQP